MFDLATPALLIERARLDANVAAMAARARAAGVALRPHIKTVKVVEAAVCLHAAGASGFAVPTLPEARALGDVGLGADQRRQPLRRHFFGRGYVRGRSDRERGRSRCADIAAMTGARCGRDTRSTSTGAGGASRSGRNSSKPCAAAYSARTPGQ